METKRLVAGFAAAAGLVGAVGAGSAIAQDSLKSAHGIPNLTDVKQEITAYHDSGNWDRELAKADGSAQSYLARRLRHGVDKPAIVLDIEDIALETYSYEVQHDFGYDRTQWNDYAYAKKFGAVTSTLALVKYAAAHQVSVFFVTGRRESDQMRPRSWATSLRWATRHRPRCTCGRSPTRTRARSRTSQASAPTCRIRATTSS